MDREDTLPWYRQFWPWFIIAPPALTVVAGLYTFWLAVQTTDSLAVRSDAGVNIVTERNLVAEREARRLGLEALVKIDKDSGAVIVTLSSSRPIETQLHWSCNCYTPRLQHATQASRCCRQFRLTQDNHHGQDTLLLDRLVVDTSSCPRAIRGACLANGWSKRRFD